MDEKVLYQKYGRAVLAADRAKCRAVLRRARGLNLSVADLLGRFVWNTQRKIDILFRKDQLTRLEESLATWTNRLEADWLRTLLVPSGETGQKAVLCCTTTEAGCLGAQICSDLLGINGWETPVLGGGIASDEIAAYLGRVRPKLVALYGIGPKNLVYSKGLIHHLKQRLFRPRPRIVAVGGIFSRASDLWDVIGADAFADDPHTLSSLAENLINHQLTAEC